MDTTLISLLFASGIENADQARAKPDQARAGQSWMDGWMDVSMDKWMSERLDASSLDEARECMHE